MRGLQYVLTIFLLSGCAMAQVDHTAQGFDEAKFKGDLADCQREVALDFVVKGSVGGVFGALAGAGEVAPSFFNSDFREGAMIGMAVGAAAGLVLGVADSLDRQEGSLGSCLSKKGYA
ncbi:MAG: hypothetical protein A2516_04800 [Alphaproteobacteria bacterium RIFOXYD12_FULL_60_8]|nr:MAG: hypothetical protein A2516_04800 [Alphaproteobacteria bacterium RIFOXYD12_FULL_60_8]